MVHSRIMAKEQEVASAARLAAEGGNASDESAVAEPEIEANEGRAEEPEIEPGESIAAEGDNSKAGCPIEMGHYNSPRCGQELHVAPDGVDETPVCLMHSKDPNKESGPLFDAFWREFERILKDAGDGEAHFEHFVFPELDFCVRVFKASCRFNFAIFTQNADFTFANFTRDAHFNEATFTQDVNFHGATFTQDANFIKATFTKVASFFSAIFTRDALFSEATFTQNVGFREATFTQVADFVKTEFHGTAYWEGGRFLDRAEFRQTKFEPSIEGKPSAVFALAKFSKPSEVVFDDVDLSRVLFHNCDVSQVWFTSSVQWRKREDNIGLVVFEETISLEQEFGRALLRDGRRDYQAVAQVYRQLKKNYDFRLDYRTANAFHFGEMEMMRLAEPAYGKIRASLRVRPMWLRQWLLRHLTIVALYRYVSDYGNSYWKPLSWLLGLIFILFPLLLPLPGVGLIRQGATQAETYATNWNFQKGYGENLWAKRDLVGNSVIASMEVATFQRNPEYAPTHPWGRVVAIVETLLTSSLFALFLLAIRRQFRR